MRNLKVKKWWKAAGVRAIKTVAQTAVATIGTAAVLSAVDWRTALSASVLAGVLSILTSIAGLREVNTENKEKEFFYVATSQQKGEHKCQMKRSKKSLKALHTAIRLKR